MSEAKKSRCAFVLAKFVIDGAPFLLMRQNERWKDLNFIGGHETEHDAGNFRTAARRELLEELPALRRSQSFELVALTGEVLHGPLVSRSANCRVEYELQFFLLKFATEPEGLARAAGRRSLNVFVPEDEVLAPRQYQVSGLVQVLDRALTGGIRSAPLSWTEDIGPLVGHFVQRELPLRWGVENPESR